MTPMQTARVLIGRTLPFVVLLAIVLRLLIPPLEGVADNGDAYRVASPAGIRVPRPSTWRVEPSFPLYETRFWRRPSSGALVALVARALPFPARLSGRFDVRAMGVAYGLVLLALLALARTQRVPTSLALAFTLVLASPFYADFLQSFYGDAAALVGVFGVAMLLGVRGRARTSKAPLEVGILLCAGLAGFAGRAHQVIPAALLTTCAITHRSAPRSRAFYLALTSLALVAHVHAEHGRGFRFPQINGFHGVYHGVAMLADDPDEVLAELGLPRASRTLVGQRYFDVDLPHEVAARVTHVRPASIVHAYAARPRAMGRAAERVGEAIAGHDRIGLVRTPRARATTRAPRLSPLPWLPTIALLALYGLAVAQVVLDRRGAKQASARLFLLIVILVSGITAVIGDGMTALPRHLLVATLATDLLLATLLVEALRSTRAWARKRAPSRPRLDAQSSAPHRDDRGNLPCRNHDVA